MRKIRKSKDIFSKEKRSNIMAAIRSKNTKLEKDVFRELKKDGFRFKTHYKGVLGKPDIAIPSQKKVIFIDSDFWHGWRYSQWSFSGRNDFWDKKILMNRKRDIFVTRELRRLNWCVLRVWEHQLKRNRIKTIGKMEAFLSK